MHTSVPWAIQDRSTHWGVDAFVWVCHTFRMPVFFLLAGFFGRLVHEKLGPAGFIRHRAKRILLPFVVTLIPLMPSLYFLWKWGVAKGGARAISRMGTDLPALEPGVILRSPGHLWFLYYLMIVLALLLMVLSVARRLPLGGLKRSLDGILRGLVRFGLVPFVMAVPTAATLYFMQLLAADTPVDYVPQVRILAYYLVFAGFGWLLHRQGDLVEEFGRRLWIPLVLAGAILVPLGQLVDRTIQEGPLVSLAARTGALYLGALFGWSLVILFLGAFVRWGDKPRPWVSYLSDASYWCYLVHLPVVVALQILVAGLAWPGLIKYALIMAATLAACLGSYRLFVRYTFIGATLNGPRERPVSP
jgi:peptidoglycan/LPS O-acetylase OafA/YrhL